MMKKYFLAVMVMPVMAFSQLHPYKWRLGVHGGFSTYYGDLTPYKLSDDGIGRVLSHLYTYNQEYTSVGSWQVSLERYINPAMSLKIALGNVNFRANDRFVKPDGTLWTESPNFDRGLNAETFIYDASIGLIFKTDNLRFLSHRAFIAPYVGLHLVGLTFETYGDLRDNEGNFYNLSDPELRQNGEYETPLTGLKTEGTDYSTLSFGGRLELGFRFRLSRQLDLNISTQYTITATDYLDDISLEYPSQFSSPLQQRASDPTNRRSTTSQRGDNLFFDTYLFHSFGIQWSFGSAKRMKKFPTIGGFAPPPSSMTKASIFDPAILQNAASATETYRDSALVLIQNQQEEIQELRNKLNMTITGLQIIESRLKASDLKSKEDQIQSDISTAEDSIKNLDELLIEVQLDTILPQSVKDSLSSHFIKQKKQLERQRDSLSLSLKKILQESDSLITWVESSDRSIDYSLLTPSVKSYPKPVMTPQIPSTLPVRTPIAVMEKSSLPDQETEIQAPTNESTEKKSTDGTQSENNLLPGSEIQSSQATQTKQPPQKQKSQSAQTTIKSPSQPSSYVRTPSSTNQPAPRSTQPPISNNKSETSISVNTSRLTDDPREKPDTKDTDSYIVKILEQQTIILKLLTEQINALSTQQKTDSLPIQPVTIEIAKVKISEATDSSDSLEEETKPQDPDTQGRASFESVAGFKTRTSIYFQSGRTTLDSAEELHLRDIAKFLADSVSSNILLKGYADNTGSRLVNFQVIEKRLAYVRKILVEEGVIPTRIREEKGGIIVKNTPGPEPLDRRVEIILLFPRQ